MKIIKLTCPNCGAPLQFDPAKPIHFCSHCGTPLLFDNESKTVNVNYREEKYIYDEGRVAEAEAKKEEYKYKMKKDKNNHHEFNALIVVFIALLFVMVAGGLGFFG